MQKFTEWQKMIHTEIYGFVYTHEKVYKIQSFTCNEDMLLYYCYDKENNHYKVNAEILEVSKVSGYRNLKKEYQRLTNFKK